MRTLVASAVLCVSTLNIMLVYVGNPKWYVLFVNMDVVKSSENYELENQRASGSKYYVRNAVLTCTRMNALWLRFRL